MSSSALGRAKALRVKKHALRARKRYYRDGPRGDDGPPDIPNLTGEFVDWLKKSGERVCDCDAQPTFNKFIHRSIAGEEIQEKEVFRSACPECGGDFFKYPDHSAVIVAVGDRGGGKTGFSMSFAQEIQHWDDTKRFGFLWQPKAFVDIFSSVNWCRRHHTTCEKALGEEAFDPANGSVITYDDEGVSKTGVPRYVREGKKHKMCTQFYEDSLETLIGSARSEEDAEQYRRNVKSFCVYGCVKCPFYRNFGSKVKVFDNVDELIDLNDNHPEELLNMVFIVDESALSLNSKSAMDAEVRKFVDFIRLVRHKRVTVLIMLQDFDNLTRDLRKAKSLIIYKRIPSGPIMDNASQSKAFFELYADRVTALKKWEGIAVSSNLEYFDLNLAAKTNVGRVFQINNSLPHIYSEAMSKTFANAKMRGTPKNVQINQAAFHICELMGNRSVPPPLPTDVNTKRSLLGIIRGYALEVGDQPDGLRGAVLDFYSLRSTNPGEYDSLLEKYYYESKWYDPENDNRAKKPEIVVEFEAKEEVIPYIVREANVQQVTSGGANISPPDAYGVTKIWASDTVDSVSDLQEMGYNRETYRKVARAVNNQLYSLFFSQVEGVSRFDAGAADAAFANAINVSRDHAEMFRLYLNKQPVPERLVRVGDQSRVKKKASRQLIDWLEDHFYMLYAKIGEAEELDQVPPGDGEDPYAGLYDDPEPEPRVPVHLPTNPDADVSIGDIDNVLEEIGAVVETVGEFGPEDRVTRRLDLPCVNLHDPVHDGEGPTESARRGDDVESELVRAAWENGWYAAKTYGSGGMRGVPMTDIHEFRPNQSGEAEMVLVESKSLKFSEREGQFKNWPVGKFNAMHAARERIQEVLDEHPVTCPHCNSNIYGCMWFGGFYLRVTNGKQINQTVERRLPLPTNRMGVRVDWRTQSITWHPPNMSLLSDPDVIEFLESGDAVYLPEKLVGGS